jgi:hypothetical protein
MLLGRDDQPDGDLLIVALLVFRIIGLEQVLLG